MLVEKGLAGSYILFFLFFYFLKIEQNLNENLRLENISARLWEAETKGFFLYSHLLSKARRKG